MPTAVLPKIVDAIAALPGEIMLVLDDFDNVRSARCNDQIEFFVKHLPEKAHLVLITRADPALRLGRMRAAGQLLEIRADDLAFNVQEASSLLAVDGIELSSHAVWELRRRTEGGPRAVFGSAVLGRA
jgi:LuxR family maltose regulon positive regulatory protein